jgi:hypothetical protein
LKKHRTVIAALVALIAAMTAPAIAGPPVSVEQLQNSIGMGDMPIWDDVAAEVHHQLDAKGYLEAKRIFVGNAMKSMIPEPDQLKLLKLMPTPEIPVEILLMAVDAWHNDQVDVLLKRDPKAWWKPTKGGPDSCNAILLKEVCEIGGNCSWQNGRCGSR